MVTFKPKSQVIYSGLETNMSFKKLNISAKEMHYDELNAFQLTKPSKDNKTVKGDVACWEIVYFFHEFKLPKTGYKPSYCSRRTASQQLIQWTVLAAWICT